MQFLIRDILIPRFLAGIVRNRLHANGIHHKTSAGKERLEDRHISARLEFAQRYLEEGLDIWGRVIFSDEKIFASNTHGRLHYLKRDNTWQNRPNIYQVARSGHITCNAWGWIHLLGVGELAEISGRFNAEQYRNFGGGDGSLHGRLCSSLSWADNCHAGMCIMFVFSISYTNSFLDNWYGINSMLILVIKIVSNYFIQQSC